MFLETYCTLFVLCTRLKRDLVTTIDFLQHEPPWLKHSFPASITNWGWKSELLTIRFYLVFKEADISGGHKKWNCSGKDYYNKITSMVITTANVHMKACNSQYHLEPIREGKRQIIKRSHILHSFSQWTSSPNMKNFLVTQC